MAEGEHAGIEDAVGRELGLMGIGGTLVLAGPAIELHPAEGGAPVSIDIAPVLSQWPLLPAEMQQRKAAEIAQRLAGAHRFSRRAETKPKAPAFDASSGRVLGAVVALFGALALIGLLRYAVPRLGGDPPPAPGGRGESEGARKERLARTCDAVRERIYKGLSFGPFAAEGWVVELWVASRSTTGDPLEKRPALTALVEQGRLAPSADAELAAIRDGTLQIADGLGDGAAQRSPGWSAATLSFGEGYARAFFDETERPRFIALAERVVAASGADHAALYARCAHLPTHDVGAWFHGPDLAGATAALVYQMGFFAETRLVDRSALTAAGGSRSELEALRKLSEGLGDTAARTVGAQGAGVSSGQSHGGGGAVTVVFPFATPVRSITATRALARAMGIIVP